MKMRSGMVVGCVSIGGLNLAIHSSIGPLAAEGAAQGRSGPRQASSQLLHKGKPCIHDAITDEMYAMIRGDGVVCVTVVCP